MILCQIRSIPDERFFFTSAHGFTALIEVNGLSLESWIASFFLKKHP
jgi:hypothetical protein